MDAGRVVEEDMSKVLLQHMYTKVESTVIGVRVRCECGEVYGSGIEPPAEIIARHIAVMLAEAGYGLRSGNEPA